MKSKIVVGSRGKFTYYIGDREVSEKEFKKTCRGAVKNGDCPNTLMQTSKAWPKFSDALGVHEKQVKDAEAESLRVGVPTEYCQKTGRAIIRNTQHQRDLLKALGYVNRDAGYAQICG